MKIKQNFFQLTLNPAVFSSSGTEYAGPIYFDTLATGLGANCTKARVFRGSSGIGDTSTWLPVAPLFTGEYLRVASPCQNTSLATNLNVEK